MLSNPSCYQPMGVRGRCVPTVEPSSCSQLSSRYGRVSNRKLKKERPQRGGAGAFVLLLDMIPADGGIHLRSWSRVWPDGFVPSHWPILHPRAAYFEPVPPVQACFDPRWPNLIFAVDRFCEVSKTEQTRTQRFINDCGITASPLAFASASRCLRKSAA